MQMKIVSGASMAAAAIALAVSGAALTSNPAQAKKASIHCAGGNACKGKSACKTADNSCKGQNACKGKGFTLEKSAAACTKKGGTVG